MLAASGIIRRTTASAKVLASSSDSGHLTKKEVVCFVNGQMGVCWEERLHVVSNHDNQKVILVSSMFIIRARKLEVSKKVVSVEPELGKFSSPIKEKELYIFPLLVVDAQLWADYERLES
jgi:hypothetical protein